jgi:hypothetical protein
MIRPAAHQTFTCQPLAGELIMMDWAGGRAKSDAVNQAKNRGGLRPGVGPSPNQQK